MDALHVTYLREMCTDAKIATAPSGATICALGPGLVYDCGMPYSKKQLALFHIRCAQGDTKYCKLLARERKKGHLYEKGGPNDPNRKGK